MNWWQILLSVLGSSTFTGLITTYVSYKLQKGFNDKKLNAEIISKARIDWINEVRKISAQYIYSCNRSLMLKRKRAKFIKQRERSVRDIESNNNSERHTKLIKEFNKYNKKVTETVEEFNEEIAKIIEKRILLNLYFTNEKQVDKSSITHNQITSDMKSLTKSINDFKPQNDKVSIDYNNEIESLSNLIGKYLKQEWDRAKAKE
ncbi:hypothetical protein ACHLL8_01735 [Staphylococcus aureus]|uniref:hypothetical protein n=1 Tax=Staphylococcus aureus TaxID=1280 RepID=UPI00229F7895|nr:hypothetical protein [Staphylococcus aureus]EJX2099125.1 hypothetical protein [Staphylococcus aureus]ELL5616570.1 hypothetical protein [Staphylococcus aureus]MCC1458923.1 hypothetical protein [Staphylococcus aureus]MDI1539304.1 hypothetical protein [Staphylococcus aureus]MDI1947648.1 hypothetical protein [Staphylococcus aureus]